MLRSARADLEELLISARRRGNAEHIIWATTLLGPVLMSLNRTEEAIALDDEATGLFNDKYKLSAANFLGNHMQALVAQRRIADAISYASVALRQLGPMPVWFHFVGLTAMTRTCVDMLGQERGLPLEKEARWVTRRALRALHRYVRVYPFCAARYHLYVGMYRSARGQDRAARRRWKKALRMAEESELKLDGARIRLLLADQLPEDAPARREYLRQARQTLNEIGLRRLEGHERR
jgi:tetratricopeptide (TPR) repeat protein